MYKIIKDSATIALTETPTYICLHANGSYVLSDEQNAQGIAHGGTVYHLLGRPDMGDVETVMLTEVDSGAEVGEIQTAVDDLTVVTLMGGGDVV